MPKYDYVASRAEIIQDEPEEKSLLADASDMYRVVDTRTGAVVGQAKTLSRARSILDKRDNAYGGYIHKIVPPVKPAPAG